MEREKRQLQVQRQDLMRNLREQYEQYFIRMRERELRVKVMITLATLSGRLRLLAKEYNKVREAAVMKEVRNFSAWKIAYRFHRVFRAPRGPTLQFREKQRMKQMLNIFTVSVID